MIKKILLATAVMALASTPAWAMPTNSGTEHRPASTPQGPPSSTPNDSSNNGSKNRSETGDEKAGGSDRHDASADSESGSKADGSKDTGSTHSEGHKGSGKGEKGKGDKGKSHRCKPHAVAYIVAGKLLKWELKEVEESKGHLYEGSVTLEVKHTNRHAREAEGEVTYELAKVHVHGPVSVENLKEGDRVRVIGKITFLPKRCPKGEGEEEFKPTVTVHRLIFHAPRHASSEEGSEGGEPTSAG